MTSNASTKAVATRTKAATVDVRKALDSVGTLKVADIRKAWSREALIQRGHEAAAVADFLSKADRDGVMWDRALLVFNGLFVSGMVSGQTNTKGAKVPNGAPFKTQGEFGKSVGIAPSYLSRIVRLGRAAGLFGVRQGSSDWAYLVTNANAEPFSALLMGEPTKDAKASLRKALDSAKAEKSKPAKKAPGKTAAEKKAEEKAKKDAEAAKKVPATPADLVHFLRTEFAATLHRFDDDGARIVREAMSEVSRGDLDARIVIAEKATKDTAKKATPADVAAKSKATAKATAKVA